MYHLKKMQVIVTDHLSINTNRNSPEPNHTEGIQARDNLLKKMQTIHLSIYSLNKHLLNTYYVLSTRDTEGFLNDGTIDILDRQDIGGREGAAVLCTAGCLTAYTRC